MSGGRTCKLTNSVIKSLVVTGKDYDVRDTEVTGFHVRVTKAGTKIFRFQYRNAVKKRETVGLGRVGLLTVDEARKMARDLFVRVKSGEDPVAERRRKIAACKMGDLWELYRRERLLTKNRPRTVAEYERNWKTHLAPLLADSRVEEVTRKQIYEVRSSMAHIPTTANRALALLSVMFNFAIQRDICAANPVKGVEKFPENVREDIFTDEEIERIVRAVMNDSEVWSRSAMMLLISTGARLSEVLGAEWSELNLDPVAPTWRIPSARMKGKKPHTYPLSPRMAEMLLEWKVTATLMSMRWVFPNAKGTGPKDKLQKQWKRIKLAAGITHGSLHTFRHAYLTRLAMSGASAFDIKNIAGHADIATSDRYVHASQNTRIREMVEQNSSGVWAALEGSDKKGEVRKLHPS